MCGTVLIEAIKAGNISIVRELIRRGASPKHRRPSCGKSELYWLISEMKGLEEQLSKLSNEKTQLSNELAKKNLDVAKLKQEFSALQTIREGKQKKLIMMTLFPFDYTYLLKRRHFVE